MTDAPIIGPPPDIDFAAAAVFLDFDGTLAPFAPRPNFAKMAPSTRAALVRLRAMAGGALAIVSGRALDSLDERLSPMRLPAAGSHGLERRTAEGELYVEKGGEAVAAAVRAARAFARAHNLLLEEKPAGAAIHYRERPQLAAACRQAIDRIGERPGFRTIHGDMIAEFSLEKSNKGMAIEAFMAELPFKGRTPFFAGDDLTDEDGFRVVVAMGGVALKIGEGETLANYRIGSHKEFLAWLETVSFG